MVRLIIAYSSMAMAEEATHALLFSGVSRMKKNMYRKTADISGRPIFNIMDERLESGESFILFFIIIFLFSYVIMFTI